MVRTLRLCRFCCCLVGFGMCVVTNQTILFSVYNFVFLSLNHVVHAGNPSEHLTPKRKRQCNCKNSKSVPPFFFVAPFNFCLFSHNFLLVTHTIIPCSHRCLKLYCECFASWSFCDQQTCHCWVLQQRRARRNSQACDRGLFVLD